MTDYPAIPSTLSNDLTQSDWEDMCAIVEDGLAQGDAVEIYRQWVEDGYGESADLFLDLYVTTTDDIETWAEEFYEEIGGSLDFDLAHYVDWGKWANDLSRDGSMEIMEDDRYPGTFHIIHPN